MAGPCSPLQVSRAIPKERILINLSTDGHPLPASRRSEAVHNVRCLPSAKNHGEGCGSSRLLSALHRRSRDRAGRRWEITTRPISERSAIVEGRAVPWLGSRFIGESQPRAVLLALVARQSLTMMSIVHEPEPDRHGTCLHNKVLPGGR